ncbi:MAG: AsmA family protein, partial [Burkholderiaceae bacterium]|nr:AsmA family protein [Burkholderiaceae bacterium]
MLLIAALVVGLPALAVVVLLNFDWNRARPWLNERTSEAIGRPFAIEGDLTLSWERAEKTAAGGWRDMVPWPHLTAREVRIGNPASMTAAAPAPPPAAGKPAAAPEPAP